jgi:hypothetical protein
MRGAWQQVFQGWSDGIDKYCVGGKGLGDYSLSGVKKFLPPGSATQRVERQSMDG